MIKTYEFDARLIVLVGTAHVSQASVQEVTDALEQYSANAVAVELDEDRYKALTEAQTYRELDIVKIIKQNKVASLLAQMFLASFQQKVAKQLNQTLGEDMKTAMDFAHNHQIELLRIDRSVQTTLLRIWHSLSFFDKVKLGSELLASLFETKISTEQIEALKQEDLLESALADVGKLFPNIRHILIDERDRLMAHRLRSKNVDVIVAVVGAAHVPGILKYLEAPATIEGLLDVPKAKKASYWTWLFPAFLIGITLLSMAQAPNLALNTLLRFILINGSLAALGTLLAFGHPLSALSAFVMAPVGLLSPVLATGFFAGICEAYLRKPRVEDFMNLNQDLSTVKGYWRNRVARILLIVMFANIFASLGSIVYSIDIIQRLFN
jgi:pheromone shutdown-related protein TraB